MSSITTFTTHEFAFFAAQLFILNPPLILTVLNFPAMPVTDLKSAPKFWDATLIALFPDGSVYRFWLLLSRIEDSCPLLAASFEQGPSGEQQASIEASCKEVVCDFLRFLNNGECHTDDQSSLLRIAELFKLAVNYDVQALQAKLILHWTETLDEARFALEPPADLCEAIRFVYEVLSRQEIFTDALLQYCVYSFKHHHLDTDAAFRKVAFDIREFHTGLCQTSFRRNFQDSGAMEIMGLPVCRPNPSTCPVDAIRQRRESESPSSATTDEQPSRPKNGLADMEAVKDKACVEETQWLRNATQVRTVGDGGREISSSSSSKDASKDTQFTIGFDTTSNKSRKSVWFDPKATNILPNSSPPGAPQLGPQPTPATLQPIVRSKWIFPGAWYEDEQKLGDVQGLPTSPSAVTNDLPLRPGSKQSASAAGPVTAHGTCRTGVPLTQVLSYSRATPNHKTGSTSLLSCDTSPSLLTTLPGKSQSLSPSETNADRFHLDSALCPRRRRRNALSCPSSTPSDPPVSESHVTEPSPPSKRLENRMSHASEFALSSEGVAGPHGDAGVSGQARRLMAMDELRRDVPEVMEKASFEGKDVRGELDSTMDKPVAITSKNPEPADSPVLNDNTEPPLEGWDFVYVAKKGKQKASREDDETSEWSLI